jgi:hypothetical protein
LDDCQCAPLNAAVWRIGHTDRRKLVDVEAALWRGSLR